MLFAFSPGTADGWTVWIGVRPDVAEGVLFEALAKLVRGLKPPLPIDVGFTRHGNPPLLDFLRVSAGRFLTIRLDLSV